MELWRKTWDRVPALQGILVVCIVLVCSVPGVSALNTNCPGFLTVTSTPAGALVYIDGTYQGTTPANNIEINRGQHNIRLSLNGYFDTTDVLTIACESKIPKYYTLTPIPITTTPTPAYVTCQAPCECLSPKEATAGSGSSQCSASPCGKTIPLGDSLPAIKYCYKPIESNPPAVVPAIVQPPKQVIAANIPAQPGAPAAVLAQPNKSIVVPAQRQGQDYHENNSSLQGNPESSPPASPQSEQGPDSGSVLVIGGLVGLVIIGGLGYYGISRRSGGPGDASDVRKDPSGADFRPRKEVNQFVTRYAQDPEFRRQLKSNPADAIKNSGLDINDEDFAKLQAHSISELEKVFSNIPSVTRQGQSSAASASAVAAVYNFEGTSLPLGGFQPSDSLKQLMEKMVSDPSVRNLFQQDPMGAVKMISDLNLAPEELSSLRKLPIGQVIHGFSSIPNTTPTDIMDAANILSRTTHSIK